MEKFDETTTPELSTGGVHRGRFSLVEAFGGLFMGPNQGYINKKATKNKKNFKNNCISIRKFRNYHVHLHPDHRTSGIGQVAQ